MTNLAPVIIFTKFAHDVYLGTDIWEEGNSFHHIDL